MLRPPLRWKGAHTRRSLPRSISVAAGPGGRPDQGAGGVEVVTRPRGGVERGRFTDAFLDPMRAIGDPVADEAVAAVFADGDVDAVNDLMATLVRATDPDPKGLPPSVRDYLDLTFELPDWANTERIDSAQRTFAVWGPQISICLFCASLPSAYACADGAQVLRITARLATDARRRIMETGQFVMDVMVPGGLDDGGAGRRTIQRVRLMHAAVRHLVSSQAALQPGLWDPAWGHPLNQEDLAGTLLSFAYVPAEPLRRLGVRVSDNEAEDYLHCWNVVGHQLGLVPDLLTRDLTEAGQLVDAIRIRHTKASEAGIELTAALVELLEELIPKRRLDVAVPALIRRLAGPEVADLLGVPADGWPARVGLRAWSALNRVIHLASDDFEVRLAPIGRAMLEAGFKMERGGTRPTFEIPESLAGAWKVKR